MLDMKDIAARAEVFGFSHAGALDAATLEVLDNVRDMCAADRCQKYDRCWTCPPASGSIADNRELLKKYSAGVIVQTTMALDDDFDIETMELCGETQQKLFREFARELRPAFPDMLALGSGGCSICESCTYPGAPCRHPDEAMQSMEAFGLFVSDVCAKNGIGYYYGPKTITYTGCYLLK